MSDLFPLDLYRIRKQIREQKIDVLLDEGIDDVLKYFGYTITEDELMKWIEDKNNDEVSE